MKKKDIARVYLFSCCLLLMSGMVSGCQDNRVVESNGNQKEKKNVSLLPESTRTAMKKIAQDRILFGHHSVGDDILAGLQDIAGESGIAVKVIRIDDSASVTEPAIYHFYPGKNTQPRTKIDDFVRFFEGNKPDIDIAFMKLCFVDLGPQSTIEELMNYYKNKMEQLQRQHPAVTFVHCTVPLTARSYSLKDRVKRLLGLQVWGDVSNLARMRYNTLLLKEFSTEKVFDLAAVESTRPDGSRTTFASEGQAVPCLAVDYSDDGGHLNELGRKVVASAMVRFLSEVSTVQQ